MYAKYANAGTKTHGGFLYFRAKEAPCTPLQQDIPPTWTTKCHRPPPTRKQKIQLTAC